MDEQLARLAELLQSRNAIDAQIAAVIGRPALTGHIGEWIAARIFPIAAHKQANIKGSDGIFTAGLLAGQSVNVKWYWRHENVLDINVQAVPDWYLVLAGPRGNAISSQGQHRPALIHAVYLLHGSTLLEQLKAFKVKIGIATSVRKQMWEKAEIYPRQVCQALILSPEQNTVLDRLASI